MPEGHTPRSRSTARKRLSIPQIVNLAQGFAQAGTRKIRLTGGEPLLRKDLADLVHEVHRLPGIEEVALTTNGSLLRGQALALRQAGLSRITISLDAADPIRFTEITGGGDLEDVLGAIDAAERVGFSSIKINCVLKKGVNDDQIVPLINRFRGTSHVLRFIEFMDVGNCNAWKNEQVVPSSQVLATIRRIAPLERIPPTSAGEVATRYAFVDGTGEVGLISSITEPFCGNCNRARISSIGDLYTCLFATEGVSLSAEADQGPGAVEQRIRQIWSQRRDRYSELRTVLPSIPTGKRIEMYMIGG
jgi:cyclic pyranopterin phosphate synthase